MRGTTSVPGGTDCGAGGVSRGTDSVGGLGRGGALKHAERPLAMTAQNGRTSARENFTVLSGAAWSLAALSRAKRARVERARVERARVERARAKPMSRVARHHSRACAA